MRSEWNRFRKYHYLDHKLNPVSRCFEAFINNEPVGFCSVLPLPHPVLKKAKRIHRLVVLPDYQGIGIGLRLLNRVADYYKENGFTTRIVTSTPSLIFSLKKFGWNLLRYGRLGKQSGNLLDFNKTSSSKRNTFTFLYKPKK